MRRAGTQYATRMDPSCVDFRVCECSRGAGLPLITFRYKTELYSHERRFDPLDDRHREVLHRNLARDLEACGVATRNNRPFPEGDPDLGDRRRSQRGSHPKSQKAAAKFSRVPRVREMISGSDWNAAVIGLRGCNGDLLGWLRTSDKPASFSLKVLTEAGCQMT